MFKNAKIGDMVFNYLLQEWGKIISIKNTSLYPINVKFNNSGCNEYTFEGKELLQNAVPVLFWDEVKPITPPKKPLLELEVDTRVFVWDLNNKRDVLKRYFSHFDSNGKIHCFPAGSTSWSSNENTILWDNWELAE